MLKSGSMSCSLPGARSMSSSSAGSSDTEDDESFFRRSLEMLEEQDVIDPSSVSPLVLGEYLSGLRDADVDVDAADSSEVRAEEEEPAVEVETQKPVVSRNPAPPSFQEELQKRVLSRKSTSSGTSEEPPPSPPAESPAPSTSPPFTPQRVRRIRPRPTPSPPQASEPAASLCTASASASSSPLSYASPLSATPWNQLSLEHCRKVSVMVRVRPLLHSHEQTQRQPPQLLSQRRPPKKRGTPSSTTPSSNETQEPQSCLFPLADSHPLEPHDHDTATNATVAAVLSGSLILVNPTTFGRALPTDMTIAAAKYVAETAHVASEDWARKFHFDDVLWPAFVPPPPPDEDAPRGDAVGVEGATSLLKPGSPLQPLASAMVNDALLRGTSTACMAHGAHQSGKTLCILGSYPHAQDCKASSKLETQNSEKGLFELVVQRILQRSAQGAEEDRKTVTVSMLEVKEEDRESWTDLLAPAEEDGDVSQVRISSGGNKMNRKVMRVVEHRDGLGAIVQNLTLVGVDSEQVLKQTIDTAHKARSQTSNGHVIITIIISKQGPAKPSQTSQPKPTRPRKTTTKPEGTTPQPPKEEQQQQTLATIQLVILASSDNLSHHNKDERKRTDFVRTSIAALGAVLRQLIVKHRSTVTSSSSSLSLSQSPSAGSYRASVLTRLLKRTLDPPQAKVVLLATVRPDRSCYTQTLLTLNFASRLFAKRGQTAVSPFQATAAATGTGTTTAAGGPWLGGGRRSKNANVQTPEKTRTVEDEDTHSAHVAVSPFGGSATFVEPTSPHMQKAMFARLVDADGGIRKEGVRGDLLKNVLSDPRQRLARVIAELEPPQEDDEDDPEVDVFQKIITENAGILSSDTVPADKAAVEMGTLQSRLVTQFDREHQDTPQAVVAEKVGRKGEVFANSDDPDEVLPFPFSRANLFEEGSNNSSTADNDEGTESETSQIRQAENSGAWTSERLGGEDGVLDEEILHQEQDQAALPPASKPPSQGRSRRLEEDTETSNRVPSPLKTSREDVSFDQPSKLGLENMEVSTLGKEAVRHDNDGKLQSSIKEVLAFLEENSKHGGSSKNESSLGSRGMDEDSDSMNLSKQISNQNDLIQQVKKKGTCRTGSPDFKALQGSESHSKEQHEIVHVFKNSNTYHQGEIVPESEVLHRARHSKMDTQAKESTLASRIDDEVVRSGAIVHEDPQAEDVVQHFSTDFDKCQLSIVAALEEMSKKQQQQQQLLVESMKAVRMLSEERDHALEDLKSFEKSSRLKQDDFTKAIVEAGKNLALHVQSKVETEQQLQEVEKMLSELQVQKEGLVVELESLRGTLEKRNVSIDQLRLENNKLKADSASTESKLEQVSSSLTNLKKSLQRATESEQKTKHENKKLDSSLKGAKGEIDRYRATLTEAKQTNLELQAEVAEIRCSLDSTREQLLESERREKVKDEANAQLTNEAEALRSSAQRSDAQRIEVEKHLEDLKLSALAVQEDLVRTKKECSTLKESLEESRSNATRLEDEMNMSRTMLEEARGRLRLSQKTVEELELSKGVVESQLAHSVRNLSLSEENSERHKCQTEQLKMEVGRLAKSEEQLGLEKQDLLAKCEELTSGNQRAQQVLRTLSDEREKYLQDLLESKAELEKCQKQNEELKVSLDEMRSENDEILMANQDLLKSKEELEQELDEHSLEHSHKLKELLASEMSRKENFQENEDLRSKVESLTFSLQKSEATQKGELARLERLLSSKENEHQQLTLENNTLQQTLQDMVEEKEEIVGRLNGAEQRLAEALGHGDQVHEGNERRIRKGKMYSSVNDTELTTLESEHLKRKKAEEIACFIATRAKSSLEKKEKKIVEMKMQLALMQERSSAEVGSLKKELAAALQLKSKAEEVASMIALKSKQALLNGESSFSAPLALQEEHNQPNKAPLLCKVSSDKTDLKEIESLWAVVKKPEAAVFPGGDIVKMQRERDAARKGLLRYKSLTTKLYKQLKELDTAHSVGYLSEESVAGNRPTQAGESQDRGSSPSKYLTNGDS